MYRIVVMKSGKTLKSYDKTYDGRKVNSAYATIKRNWAKRDPFAVVRIKKA